ncbi:MAG: FAD-dependent oxidoreductase [Proteobacteria bacterium]|nr:FAD-dependent oxidoreductase [Pseudomonadota bacterium]
MAREPRYDILFEPLRIGPVTARNRFYQVPHCIGMGHAYPRSAAALRGVKAEGGWAVVCTEECEIHPTGDIAPNIEQRLWDDGDIPMHAAMTDAVHAHGALAGIELAHSGHHAPNLYSRLIPLAPSHLPYDGYEPVQARAMDKEDIRNLRRWHREAALRAKKAGFDIVYVYAGHDLTLPMHFISRRTNDRSDEYGGSLENRVRLFRELIEETKEAIGDRCAIAVRFAVDELLGADGITAENEGREVVEMLAELPDLWDVNISDWANDSTTSRFAPEGSQEKYVAFVKKLTTKPVVGVGRFTSPDTMVAQIKRGVLDFIGAARPSIADPFLPKKIEEGRPEDIRECIGCNICVTGDLTMTPIRCTQNPTMGEEHRRGWHPEAIAPKGSEDGVLIVGAGPAGLEAARALGARGYGVALAEASAELGGRVAQECRLPGLAEWARVADYRVSQIEKMTNVEVYRASRLSVADVLEFAPDRVVLALGARWRRDGIGRRHHEPIPGSEGENIYTPDDALDGAAPAGPVLVYDDDHYYMGGVLAEKLKAQGAEVVLATPAPDASHWTHNTMEQSRIQARLLEMGVEIVPLHKLAAIGLGEVELECVYTGKRTKRPAASVFLVTARLPEDALYHELMAAPEALRDAGIASVDRIGDCLAPGTIAAAVYSGHLYARELDAGSNLEVPFKVERHALQ